MDNIYRFFKENYNVSPEDWKIFSSKLKFSMVKKKQVLLKKGAIENRLSFLSEGLIRFYIPKIENDLTLDFIFENNFFSSYESFLTRKPSEYRVETISDSRVWYIDYIDLQEVYEKTKIGNLVGRKASEHLYVSKSKRELSFLKDSAEERYVKLFTEQPRLLKEIPLKYIASYVGVTPQALSRIRKRIS